MSLSAADWCDKARALRTRQRMVEADEALAQARALAPDDRLIAFLAAQSRYELGHEAAALFADVCRLWPDNLDALRNRALAQASERQVEAGVQGLSAALAAHPQWLDGHRVLAALRWVSGDAQGFDASYRVAARAHPGAQGLWLGWFSAVAQHRDWPRAAAILNEAAVHLGETRAITEARLFIASESGDAAQTAKLLVATRAWDSPFLQIARVRQALRDQDPAKALAIALPLAQAAPHGPLAGQLWPYVSTCWRLLGDDLAGWLDGDPAHVRVAPVGLSSAELAELAALLRRLHTTQLPYAEQSVRAGTQTDRSVLLRHEPILARAREALMATMGDYVARLPCHDPAHPLLGRPREALRISGSWSVRLGGGGYNVTHSHPMGWISSAFYVAVPEAAEMGAPPAGHFHYGAPPAELGLDLAPYGTIAPQVGDLVMFPSTLWQWHGANNGRRKAQPSPLTWSHFHPHHKYLAIAKGKAENNPHRKARKRRQGMSKIRNIKELAELAGVSTGTVSRALAGSDLISAKTRERIQALAKQHAFRPNVLARNLRIQRHQHHRCADPAGHERGQHISDPFFITMLGLLADKLTERGYDLLLSRVIPADSAWLERFATSGRADGLIVIGQSDQAEAIDAWPRPIARWWCGAAIALISCIARSGRTTAREAIWPRAI